MLNWNGFDKTVRAVASLLALQRPPHVIVVDNGSGRNEAERLAERFPEIAVLPLPSNRGFAQAVNAGAAHALARGSAYLLLFNNDAWFDANSGTLALLERFLETHPRAAAAGPEIFNPDGSRQSFGYAYSLWFPIARPCRGADSSPRFLSGSCLLVRAASFARVDGFDEDFFFYGEDVDFALRVAAIGETFERVAGGSVVHERGASIGIYSPNYAYTAIRSSLIVVRKHARAFHYPTAIATLLAASLALTVIGAARGNPAVGQAVLRAWLHFLSGRWGGYDGVKRTSSTATTVLRMRAAAGRIAAWARATLPDGAYVALRPRVEKWLGLREPELEYLLREHRRGRRFVDVGANWGSYTVLLQPNFDRIDAFEPIARCAAALRVYASAHECELGVHGCALGDRDATVALLIPPNDGFDRSARARIVAGATEASAVGVEARTLDSFGFDDVDLVKIDVEGYERHVIAGAFETLARCRPTLLVEIEQRHIDEPLADRIAFIEGLGYRASFLRAGRLVAASELVPERDQHPANVGKRERYVNNFFFEPAEPPAPR